MHNPKYKLVSSFRKKIVRGNYEALCYRIQALRDIPEHGVKAGDFGGYVSHKKTLSHEGSCWIGGDAIVNGKRISINDNAYIGDNAIIQAETSFFSDYYTAGFVYLSGNTKVTGNAFISSIYRVRISIEDYAHIFGHAHIENVRVIKGHAKIHGNARLDRVNSVEGSAEIFGNARIGLNCHIMGMSKILGNAKLEQNVEVKDSVIAGTTHILAEQKVWDGKIANDNLIGTSLDSIQELSSPVAALALPGPSISPSFKAFTEIKENIAAYENDVVKIIKYPVMTDRTNPFTQEMVLALNTANRLSDTPETKDFKDAVRELEKAFLAAESNAIKLSVTLLSEKEQRKVEKAKDLLAVAANEASSEQEKKVSFKQAFKQLEGVIVVPEMAVDTFRLKYNLKEIEA